MSSQPFVIRIMSAQGENMDWTVQNPLSFQQVLVSETLVEDKLGGNTLIGITRGR